VMTTAGILMASRRCLLLPTGNQIRPVRLCLLFGFQFRGIVHWGIVGDGDVGDAPGARFLYVEHNVLKRWPGRLNRDYCF
jgi:hypothetical protein